MSSILIHVGGLRVGDCQASIPTMVIQRGVYISAVLIYGGCGEMFLEGITQDA